MEKIIACDDGKVKKFDQRSTLVACISYNEIWPVDIRLNYVHTDGLDATSILSYMIKEIANNNKGIVLLDSITIAGFNLISLPGLYKLTGFPSIVIYNYKPSLSRINSALIPNFGDSDIREKILSILKNSKKIKTNKGILYIVNWGVNNDDAKLIINSLQHYSRIPEPLRVAHMIASKLSDVINNF